jgi:regulator of nucleoside diphosphate kinase
MEALAHERILTQLDHLRLSKLIHRLAGGEGTAVPTPDVEGLLDSAMLVAPRDVCANVVTMYSQVLLSDPASGRQRKLTLCYPWDADPAAGFVSVLSPVGSSLLGLRVGATAHWRTPVGEVGAADVLAILFQPEASGDYTM